MVNPFAGPGGTAVKNHLPPLEYPGICIAPQYLAEELLKSVSLSDVQYIDVGDDIYPASVYGKVDISMRCAL